MTNAPSRILLFGRLSYPHLFEKYVAPAYESSSEPAYSAGLIMSKESIELCQKKFDPNLSNSPDWKKICGNIISNPRDLHKIALQVAEENFPKGHKGRPADFNDREFFLMIPRDGSKKPDSPGYGPGTWFFTMNNRKDRPLLLNQWKVKVLEETADLFYPGCFVLAQCTIYATGINSAKKKGIGLGLLSMQHVEEGERLGGAVGTADAFPEIAMPQGFISQDDFTTVESTTNPWDFPL